MKCRQVREILNSLIDGEQHPNTAEAREHLSRCAECREWHASMDHALDLAAGFRSVLPEEADFADSVMAQLPDSHPAAGKFTRRRLPARALAWIGVGWLVGLIALIALVLGIRYWMLPEHVVYASSQAIALVDVSSSLLAGAWVLLKLMLKAGETLFGLDILRSFASGMFLLDSLFLFAIYLFWRRRKHIQGLFILS